MEIQNRIVGHEEMDLEQILFNPKNWRVHPKLQQQALSKVLQKVGWVQSVIVNKRTGNLVDGHLRCQLAAREGAKTIPVVVVDISPEEEDLILASIDPIAEMAAIDSAKLKELLEGIQAEDEGLRLLLADIASRNKINYSLDNDQRVEAKRTLAERFIIPPFSVLDARQGYWQNRKRAWINLGIRGELGRGSGVVTNGSNRDPSNDGVWNRQGEVKGVLFKGKEVTAKSLNYYRDKEKADAVDQAFEVERAPQYVNGVLMKSDSGNDPAYYFKKQEIEKRLGREISTEEFQLLYYEGSDTLKSGSSIFDPVLCEIAYRWFCISGGHILDPFAGEATKGIVATYLGYKYTGIELRQEQIDANIIQAQDIGLEPVWICGDSEKTEELLPAGEMYDLIFTSPPYYDLEIYSENEKDGSAFESYEKFMGWYRNIFAQAVGRLRNNRFVVIKVSEIRDRKTGIYRNFVADNIQCFLDLGLHYYNEAILVTAIGSLALRAGKQFASGRKLGRTHQNVLIFYKGDPKSIKTEFPSNVEYDLPAKEGGEDILEESIGDLPATIKVKISSKSARETWNGCQLQYIKETCHGRCCTAGDGMSHIAILPREEAGIRALGGEVVDGMLVNAPEKGCPFIKDGLCSIHETGKKPLTCWTSPFTINDNNTLVVKNRNRMLICYKQEPKQMTYRAYTESLLQMFGADPATEIVQRLDAGEGDFVLEIPRDRIEDLQWIRNKTKDSL